MSRIEILEQKLLSDNWYVLHKYTYRMQQRDGSEQVQSREVYDRGNGATILLYNRQHGSVVLTRQFRFPTFVNGNTDGLLIEACAGLLDDDAPEDCIRREVAEETGYRVGPVRKVFEAYMSPGSVTEILHFFVAEYDKADKIGAGGGLAHEGEDIDVLEMPFQQALAQVASGEIRDAKTIMLLQYAQLHGLLN
ncbi:GDP-mannose pyrophosphatase NudK [Chitinimonas arctica]|uniref:GDP-mannose pyrophosphatase n=1 Tax=Chitinimonas arctica TaxID=2594795 RepID=A0A516SH23_9NEIS|nr:GDP-mannose pyrophosphatase NudK [Chitinimonas arctica]QDQ27328.1 GDP-mannose pyrophosphatase NudK [Chitinimonas arctica]